MMPLEGWRVIVTRSREQGASLGAELGALGAIPVYVPAVVISRYAATPSLLHCVRDIGARDLLIFTSVNGVEAFCALRQAAGVPQIPLEAQIAVVGPATRSALARRGVSRVLEPEEHSSLGIASALPLGHGRRAVLPRGSMAGDQLPMLLQSRGYDVRQIEVYETVPAAGDQQSRMALASADAITFLSGSAVTGTVAMLQDAATRNRVLSVVAACIGRSTAEAAASNGFENRLVAPHASVAALAETLAEYAASHAVGGYS